MAKKKSSRKSKNSLFSNNKLIMLLLVVVVLYLLKPCIPLKEGLTFHENGVLNSVIIAGIIVGGIILFVGGGRILSDRIAHWRSKRNSETIQQVSNK